MRWGARWSGGNDWIGGGGVCGGDCLPPKKAPHAPRATDRKGQTKEVLFNQDLGTYVRGDFFSSLGDAWGNHPLVPVN